MARLTRSDALDIFRRCRIDPGHNFHGLPSSDVAALLREADRVGYRKPRNAPGSRGRMFHGYLRRLADRKEG